MAKSAKNNEKKKSILGERSKNAMRKLREKIKNNPALHEEEKRKARERCRARKEAGKVKRINELSEREQRNIRKCWREKSKTSYYAKKERERLSAQLNEMIPSFTSVPEEFAKYITPQQNPQPESSRQSLKGKQIVRRNKERIKKEIELLKAKLERTCKKFSKYKKRYERLKKKGPNTPTKNVREMLIGQKVTPGSKTETCNWRSALVAAKGKLQRTKNI
ncbi:uncharacterized protein [Diabrotica undecimpunctata]|uniref:uncharacterized protein n=1 Tax=Diabrotica undecimpunctata TaxID=50387 RepID=UPI003B640A26